MSTHTTTPSQARVSTAWGLPDRVEVSGGRIAAGTIGAGPPVVLVHGTPAWSYLWRNVAERLATRYTVHLWDLLGFGDSHVASGVTPSIAQQAHTLAELLDHWGLEEPLLVGHDIGGGVVVRTHLIERVPVRALALVDAAVLGPWNTPFTDHQTRYAEAYRTMPNDVFAELTANRLRTATYHPMDPEVADTYLAPWTTERGQHRWVDQVSAVRHDDTAAAVARLGEITASTLVLWGEEDRWLPPDTGRRLAAAIPGAQYVTLPAAGHFLPEDAPDAAADELLRFFGTR